MKYALHLENEIESRVLSKIPSGTAVSSFLYDTKDTERVIFLVFGGDSQ